MIAWLDIETTGLEPKRDLILEVGIVITDDNLDVLADTSVVIGWPIQADGLGLVNMRLDANDGFTRKMHDANFLMMEVQASAHDQYSAQEVLCDFMRACCGMQAPVMGGSSITFDRSFLAQSMPKLLDAFHYRSVDVTSIRELAQRWRPDLKNQEPRATAAHRVIPDIHDSIALLGFYRESIFNTYPTGDSK